MRILISMILLLIIAGFPLKSAEPVIELQPKVTRTLAGPELWIEYSKTYYVIIALKNQYESYGYRFTAMMSGLPSTIAGFAQLRIDDYNNLYDMATELRGRVLQLEGDPRQSAIEEQRRQISDLTNRLAGAEIDIFECENERQLVSLYEERFKSAIDGISEQRRDLADERLELYQEAVYDFYRNSYPVLSVSASGNKFYFRDERLATDIGIGGMAIFNPGPILGFGNFFDMWLEYVAPRIKTGNDMNEYRTNFFSTGLHINIPVTDILKVSNFTSNLKVGGGFFWTEVRIPNVPKPSTEWNGEIMRFEINLSNFTRNFPLEAFAGYTFMFHSNDVRFRTSSPHDIFMGRDFWTNNFQMGVRFTLLRTPVVYP
jgi:hypothetical protein